MKGIQDRRRWTGFALFLALWAGLGFSCGALFWAQLAHETPIQFAGIRTQADPAGLRIRDIEATSPYRDSGLRLDDVIVWMEDSQGRRFSQLSRCERVASYPYIVFGEPWGMGVRRQAADGRTEFLRVHLAPMSRPAGYHDRFFQEMRFVFPIFLLHFIAATIIGFRRGFEKAPRSAAILFLSLASLYLPDMLLMRIASPYYLLASFFVVFLFSTTSTFFFRFFLAFPSPSPLAKKMPWLGTAALVFGWVFALWNFAMVLVRYYGPSHRYARFVQDTVWIDYPLDVLFVLLFLAGAGSLVLNIRQASSPGERRRLVLLLTICSLGLLPQLYLFLGDVFWEIASSPAWFTPAACFLGALFPLFFAWVVVRHRLFGLRFMIRQGIRFALISRGMMLLEGLALFAGLYFSIQPLFDRTVGETYHGLLAVASATAAFGVLSVVGRANRSLLAVLERKYFREALNARKTFSEFSQEVRRLCREPDRVLATLMETVSRTLHPRRVLVCLQADSLLALPADSDAMKALRRAAAGAPREAFLLLGDARHERDNTISVRLPLESPLLLGRESRVLRFLQRQTARQGGRVEFPVRRKPWPDLETVDAADRLVIEEAGILLGVRFGLESAGLSGFLLLGEKLSEEPYAAEEADFILTLAQQAAASLEHALLLVQFREQEHLLQEMEIARQVQTDFFPREQVPTPGIVYLGLCRPARFVGGDCYDFQRVGRQKLALVVGDVSGKGVSAALVMAGLQTSLRMSLSLRGEDPGAVLGEVNRHLCVSGTVDRFATLCLVLYDPQERSLAYASAGHNPAFLFRAGDNGTAAALHSTGTVLGILPAAEYGTAATPFRKGDLLVMYSDGAPEAMDSDGALYGEERFVAFLAAHRSLGLEALAEAIIEEIRQFAGAAPQSDDITLLLARGV